MIFLASNDFAHFGYHTLISARLWNFKDPKKQDFWPRINILEGNFIKKFRRRITVHQKLGVILEKKVVQIYDDQEYGNSILKEKMKEPVLDKSPPWEDLIKGKTH